MNNCMDQREFDAIKRLIATIVLHVPSLYLDKNVKFDLEILGYEYPPFSGTLKCEQPSNSQKGKK